MPFNVLSPLRYESGIAERSLSLFRAPRMHDSTATVDDLRFKALRAFKAAELRSKFKVYSFKFLVTQIAQIRQ